MWFIISCSSNITLCYLVWILEVKSDGDLPTKDPKEAENVKQDQEATKDAKGIQTMVRNFLFQAQNFLPSSSENHPIFVHLISRAPLGMIDWFLLYP